MSNVPNRKTIFVQPETHKRLKNLKRNEEETFDSVVSRILDLDDKYNTTEEVYEFEYILKNQKSKLFRVTYGENVVIEYYNRRTFEFEKNIKAWDTGNSISEEELNAFIRFIVKDSNLFVLYEMEEELVINNVWIKRV